MGTLTGVGVSHQRNAVKAAQEAVKKAFLAAGTEAPDFVLLFASLGYNPEKLLPPSGKPLETVPWWAALGKA